jgi:hypothetical protein
MDHFYPNTQIKVFDARERWTASLVRGKSGAGKDSLVRLREKACFYAFLGHIVGTFGAVLGSFYE